MGEHLDRRDALRKSVKHWNLPDKERRDERGSGGYRMCQEPQRKRFSKSAEVSMPPSVQTGLQ
jgi:hypothetical protein